MRELPVGTVTFLFTDIEGSTRRWELNPAGMQAALQRHDALLHAAIERHGGHVFKTVGDAFCAVFAHALDAVAAALAAQRALVGEVWGEIEPLRVRMALHTGEAAMRDGDYFGPALNRVARLLAAGHGGQTLLSAAASEEVREHLPTGADLVELGTYRLKDLVRPERIWQLRHPDLPGSFPALRALDSRPHNLPSQSTSFVGREAEIAEVRRLLGTARLLTLTGPGGVGKTRLGLQVAATLLDVFEDGVWLVPLAPIGDPALVVPTIAQTLGLREAPRQDALETLKLALRDKWLLLVLDNFEQVVAAGRAIAELLVAAPELRALVTSRAPLHLYAEQAFAVPPLPLPAAPGVDPVEQIDGSPATRLFLERARAAKADFAVTEASAPTIADICRRLDGLPLAIELAAARSALLPPRALLARLDHRLNLLTGGARDLPRRQQTLRSTIAWSYDLLTPDEQQLLRRMAVFVGGCTLEAIEAVAALGEPSFDVLDGVASLVDKSLLRRAEGEEDTPRVSMLETIREFALERLAESGEAAEVRWRHAAFCLAFAEAAEPGLRGPEQRRWQRRLELEHDNLRAALGWSLGPEGDLGLGLRVAAALFWFWNQSGYAGEGVRWLRALLNHTGSQAPTAARGRALGAAGALTLFHGDDGSAQAYLSESTAIGERLADLHGLGFSIHFQAHLALDQGDHATGRRLHERSVELAEAAGDRWAVAWSLFGLEWTGRPA